MTKPFAKSVCQEADEIVSGERRSDYGHPSDEFKQVSQMWSAITGVEINSRQVGLMMICLKVVRENHKHKRDNLVDIAGYAKTVELVEESFFREAFNNENYRG